MEVVAWHGVEDMARHGKHDMDGNPRNSMKPRGSKDRQHPNGAGQSRKPGGSRGMARHDRPDFVCLCPKDRHRSHERRSGRRQPAEQQQQPEATSPDIPEA